MSTLEHARQQLNEVFPTRLDHLLFQLRYYAETGQRFDVCFLDHARPPTLDASLNREFARTLATALAHWRRDKLARLLQRLLFSDGTVASIDDVWVLN